MSGFHGGHNSSSSSGFHGGSSHSSNHSSNTSTNTSYSSSTYDDYDYEGGDGDIISLFTVLPITLLILTIFIEVVNFLHRDTAFLFTFGLILFFAYIICSFVLMLVSSLFKDLNRKEFIIENEKKLIDELKDGNYKNKRGTRNLILIGGFSILVGVFSVILSFYLLDYILLGILFLAFGGLFIYLGKSIRNKFLNSLRISVEKYDLLDEKDFISYLKELEEEKKKKEEPVKRVVTVRYCEYCGKRIAKKATECRYCGAVFEKKD